jgi:hypothetical protein
VICERSSHGITILDIDKYLIYPSFLFWWESGSLRDILLCLVSVKRRNQMKQEETKKTWETPELIILTRSRAEEAVLLACKVTTEATTTANVNNGCTEASCHDCDIVSAS